MFRCPGGLTVRVQLRVGTSIPSPFLSLMDLPIVPTPHKTCSHYSCSFRSIFVFLFISLLLLSFVPSGSLNKPLVCHKKEVSGFHFVATALFASGVQCNKNTKHIKSHLKVKRQFVTI
jgi:hypothetical protein